MGFLRLLSNRSAMGEDVLNPLEDLGALPPTAPRLEGDLCRRARGVGNSLARLHEIRHSWPVVIGQGLHAGILAEKRSLFRKAAE